MLLTHIKTIRKVFIRSLDRWRNTGYVTIINPFDTPALIAALNQTLDRRLAGQEPSNPGILLVMMKWRAWPKWSVLIAWWRFLTGVRRNAQGEHDVYRRVTQMDRPVL